MSDKLSDKDTELELDEEAPSPAPIAGEETGDQKRKVGIVAIVCLVTLICLGVIVAGVVASENSSADGTAASGGTTNANEQGGELAPVASPGSPATASTPVPTSIPTSTAYPTAGTDGCRTKRVRITHICDVPDLDWSDDDGEMDIKVLIDDEVYWPRNVREDCPGGSFIGACEIPDELLTDGRCFALKNAADKVYRAIPRGVQELKVTIYDEDFWSDEYVDVFVPNAEWYDPAQCGEKELNVTASRPQHGGKASIRVVISSEETVPTAAPSQNPTQLPTVIPSPSPTKLPTLSPSQSPTTECGYGYGELSLGLADMSAELGDIQQVIAAYDANLDNRRLLWGSLVKGVSKFAKAVVTKGKQEGPLSSLADVCTLASTIFTFGSFGEDGSKIDERQGELFAQVFERFDEIDRKLDDIQERMSRGFDEIELVVYQTVANEVLDKWVKGELAILDDDYRAYLNPDHTDETRQVYETTFRNSCLIDHSPFTTFKALYGHVCRECNKLDEQANQYILDTFVDLAISKFDKVEDRIKWFRSSYGTVMISAMIQSMYLHTVCLYQPDTVCQNEDPVWQERLNEMSSGLEEAAKSLSAAEERVKCRKKKVRVTHICDLPDMDPPVLADDDMDIKLIVNGEVYWPNNIDADCVDGLGAFNGACVIPDGKLMDGKCYKLANSQQFTVIGAQTLKIEIHDEDLFTFDDTISYYIYSSDWYDDMQCESFTLEREHRGGGIIKLQIESEPQNEPWGK